MLDAMLSKLQSMAGADPRTAFKLIMARVPPSRRSAVHELGSFFGRTPDFSPPDPPAWAWDIFRELGSDYSVSPELLAALSYVAVEWDPYGSQARVGILGAPDVWLEESPLELRASLEELLEGDRNAALRVYTAAERGVELLQESCRKAGDLTRRLELYLQEGHSSSSWKDPTEELERVCWAFLVLLARSVGEEGLE